MNLPPNIIFIPADKICLKRNRPISIDEGGDPVISSETGTLVESAPIAWQEVEGAMPVAFTLKGKSEVGFSLGDHIPGIPVVIGLTLVWNTFPGSNWYDEGLAIATDGTCVHGAG